MDNPKKHGAPDDNDGASNKRPKHFHEGPNAIAQDEEEKQSSVEAAPAHASPVGRLHADALGVIFDFLWIGDLCRTLAVSRSWLAFIRSSMPCARFLQTCTAESLVVISSSALARHISGIKHSKNVRCKLTSDSLYTVALAMPQLMVLECELIPSKARKMILPAKLEELELDLSALDAAGINRAVASIGQLTVMTDLTLVFSTWQTAVSFAPLSKCASLETLIVKAPTAKRWATQPSDTQINQLRSLHHLHCVSISWLNDASLTKLLRKPHALQWTELGDLSGVDGVGAAALRNVPGLLTLGLSDCRNVSFLPALTQLQSLTLHIKEKPWAMAADAVVESLSSCHQLTLLDLMAPVTSKHLTLLLSHLTQLESLSLFRCSELESLSFLSAVPSLQRTLEWLEITQCRHATLRSTEFRHILALKDLSTLNLDRCGSEPLDGLSQHLLTPPTTVLPKLESFFYEAAAAVVP